MHTRDFSAGSDARCTAPVPRAGRWLRRQWPTFCALGAGLALTGFAATVTAKFERARLRNELEQRAGDHTAAIAEGIENNLRDLRGLKAFFDASQSVERDQFRIFTARILEDNSGVQALEWVPRVRAAERAQFETKFRAAGTPQFQITERNPDGELLPAAQRDEYFPVSYMEPLQRNERALGFDLASDPTRAATLARACDRGDIEATEPITLVQETGRQSGVLVVMPQFEHAAPLGTVEERRRALVGFVVGVYRLGDLLEASVASLRPVDLDIWLIDRDTSSGAQVLAHHPSRTRSRGSAKAPDSAAPATDAFVEHTFAVGGRSWSLRCTPAPGFYSEGQRYYSWIVFAAGLVCTFLLGSYVWQARRYAHRIERQIGERTRALVESNAALTRAAAERKAAERTVRESELKFRTLVEQIPAVTYQAALDPGSTTVYISPQIQRFLGYSPADYRADPDLWRRALHEEDRARVLAAVAKCHATGEPLVCEYRMRARDGRNVWFHDEAGLVRDESGRPLLLQGVQFDITDRKRAEEALRASETRLQLERDKLMGILDNMRDGVYIVNENCDILYVNPVFEREFGAVGGRKCHEYFHQRSEACPWCRNHEVFAGQSIQREWQPPGSDRIFDTFATPIRNADGSIIKLESFHDITARKHAEQAMCRQSELLTSILANIPYVVFWKDRASVYLGCNASFARVAGLASAADIVGKTDYDLPWTKAESDWYRQCDRQVMQQDQPMPDVEEHLLRADGKDAVILTSKVPLHDAAGQVTGLLGIFTDITDRKRMEEELRDSEGRYRAIMETAQDAIISTDAQGDIGLWNCAAERIFGYTAAEALGRNVLDLIVPRQHPEPGRWDFAEFERTGTGPLVGRTLELTGLRKDGSEIPVEVSVSSYRDHDGVRAIAVIRDITERRQSQAKLEALHRQLVDASRQAGMAEVAAGVLHNVGNVLNSLNVSATLVADRVRASRVGRLAQVAEMFHAHDEDLTAFLTVDEKGRQLPSYLQGLAEHLAREQRDVLEELLALTKGVEHIKSIVRMQQRHAHSLAVVEPLQITDVLEDVLRMNAAAFERHRIKVVRDYAELPVALLDRHVVLQILVNVVGNAKHALRDSDTPQKQLTLRATRPAADTLRVEVCDNGAGIVAENLPRLWEYGFTTKKNGHGFGLHNSALAAKALGGSLRAESAGPGRGATFTLELPLRLAEVTHG